MQSSSLVFLVLIAIWAVYLLQHWVRRREYLATARSVDRFSAAMRVLEHRHPRPEADRKAPRIRSYDVSPARPSRPKVAGERAEPPTPDVPMEPSPVVRPTRLFRFLASMSARRLRGLSLLASLSLAVIVSVLAAFSALPPWSVLVGIAAVAADVMWLRHIAVSRRADSWAVDQEWQVQQEQGEQQEQGTDLVRGDLADFPSSDIGSQEPFDAESETLVGSASTVPAGYGADPTLPIPVSAERTEPVEIPAYIDPSSWAPVPVPPPTYTLKAKAAEPVVRPAALAEPTASECWSLDGLVYDCDLDDLVERRSATGA